MPLNEAQVEILKLFAGGLTPTQIRELKQLLISFKFKLLDEAVEKAAKQRNITDADIEQALSAHWRTPYVRKTTGQFVEIAMVPLSPIGTSQASSVPPNSNPLFVDANGTIVVVPISQPVTGTTASASHPNEVAKGQPIVFPNISTNPILKTNPDSQ
jgi:hypothetical protein